MEDFIYESAKSLASMIRQKHISSKELTDACLNRIDELNPKLNAVVQVVADRAIGEALQADKDISHGKTKGPLHGVPVTIKDSLDTEGIITACGTQGRATFVPDNDATVVARLRAAGAIVLGKTNTPELTMAGETDNLVYGRTCNPYDTDKSTGGSSGGAGAIVASGGSPLDLGTDIAGSIRLPSHFCGIAGIKPTSGRTSRMGHVPSFGLGALDALLQIGPMARYVEDLSLVLPIIAGQDGIDPSVVPVQLRSPKADSLSGMRIAKYEENGVITATPETVAAIKAAALALTDAGAVVEDNRPDVIPDAPALYHKITSADGGAWLSRSAGKAGTTEMFRWLKSAVESRDVAASEYTLLLEEMDVFRAKMYAFMQHYDLILCSVCPFPAFPHGSWPEDVDTITSTVAFNMTGWPGVSVRGGTSPDGLPIGVQLVARPWREDHALSAGRCVEQALGGWRPPPV